MPVVLLGLTERIEVAEASGLVSCWAFAERGPIPGLEGDQHLVRIRCKGCGAVTRRLETLKSGVRLLNVEPNAAELVFDMADGSKHVTPACWPCAAKGLTPAEAAVWYLADVASWARGGLDAETADVVYRAAEREVVRARPPAHADESAFYRGD